MSSTPRTVTSEDVPSWLGSMMRTFFRPPVAEMVEHYRTAIDLSRALGVFDDGEAVATLRSVAQEFTVPGLETIPVSALTNVTVAATHRRRGILTDMITRDLSSSAERGEVASILVASEWPIYGRYGYGPAVFSNRLSVDTTAIRFTQPVMGAVEFCDTDEFDRVAPAIYDRHRRQQPGSILRDEHWWDRDLRRALGGADVNKSFQAIYRAPSGEEEGYVMWMPEPKVDDMRTETSLRVEALVSTTTRAYHALWHFLCTSDLQRSVTAALRPVDEVLPLLLDDGRRVRTLGQHDFVWVRLLDVPRALSARTYGTSGSLVIDVQDSLAHAHGRYRLSAEGSVAQCERTTDAADLRVSVAALGSVYLGGMSWAAHADAGAVNEETPGALELSDRLFRTARAPWNNTWF